MPVVIAPLLIPLLGFLLCLFLYMLSQGGEAFLRPLFNALAGRAGGLPVVGRLLGHGIDWLIHHTLDPITRTAISMTEPVAAFFGHLGALIEGFAFASYYTAARTYDALYALRHSTIPRLLHATTGTAIATTKRIEHVISVSPKALAREVAHLWRYGRAIEATAARALSLSERALQHAIAGTLPRALPWVGKEAAGAEAAGARAVRALKDIRALLAAGVLGGLIVKALTRAGTGNVYCRNMKNVERRLCGTDPRLLDTMLGALTLIVGTVSLIEFARACQVVEQEILDGVHSFVRP